MGTGYVRNDSGNNIADGNVINASDLDGEFDAIAATLATGGHTHDGTAAEGGPITKLGPSQDLVVTASLVNPKTDNTLDLGTASLEFKDLFIDGTAHIDTLDVDESGAIAADLTVGDDLSLVSDGSILGFGTNTEVTLTHVHNTGLLLNSTMALQFNDASQFIKGASNAILAIGATDEVDLTATLFDVNANLDVSGTALVTGVLTTTAAAVFNGGFTSNGTAATFASSTANSPNIIFKNTTNDANAPIMDFITDKGAAGADNDSLGLIRFTGDNDAQQQTTFARVLATVSDASDGAEGGKLELQVATHDGEIKSGLIVNDGNVEDEIDVTIGFGAASLTSVAGNLNVNGTLQTASGLVHLGDTNTSHDFGTDTQAFYTGGVRSLDFGTGETVFNEDGANIDFRVESDTDADTFVLDAGTGVVRIIGKSGASGSVITQHTLAIEEGGFNNGSQLIVVDSAGGKRFDCDGNGVVMVGEYSAQTVAAQIPRFQVGSNSDIESTMLAWRRSNDVKGPSFHFAKSRNTGGAAFTVVNGGDSLGQIKFFADDGANMDHSAAEIQVIASSTASGPSSNDVPGIMIFKTTVDNGIAPTEAMRIDSAQNLLIGCTVSNYPAVHGTTFSGDAITVSRSGGVTFDFNRSNTGTLGIFRQNTTDVGSIDVDGNSTTYSTSSDYRLKENVDYSWDATTRLKQLKPARFNFISDDTNTLVDGFLAHEAQAVVPKAVTGTHNEVDDAGNAVMQGIDQSKLVPLLVKTIQELEARITALEG